MLDRVILAMIPADAVPKTTAGRINVFHPPMPPEGSHRRVTEKNRINISPHQKTGMETPKSAAIDEM
jgi:hypothetical protein